MGNSERSWKRHIAPVVIGLFVLGCGDPAYSSIVVNDSPTELLARYTPTQPDLHPRIFAVEPYKGGQALTGGVDFGAWRGGSIDVLTLDCRSLGTFSLDRDYSAVRVSPSLDVSPIAVDEVSAGAKTTFLREMPGTTCEIPASSRAGG